MKSIQLKLYVAGKNQKSKQITSDVQNICTTYFASNYDLKVIDVLENPELAELDHIMAIPTLVREIPKPKRLIIGDFSDYDKVLKALDISIDH